MYDCLVLRVVGHAVKAPTLISSAAACILVASDSLCVLFFTVHALERREHSSSVQLHVSLWLLRAALEEHCKELKSAACAKEPPSMFPETDEEVAGEWGCELSGHDIVQSVQQSVPVRPPVIGGEEGTVGEEIVEEHSIQSMLQAMLKSDVHADVHAFISEVCVVCLVSYQ